MLKGLGIRLRKLNRICPIKGYQDLSIRPNSKVIVETDRGIEIGEIIELNCCKTISPIRDVKLKKVLRYASDEDLEKLSALNEAETEALGLARKSAREFELPIKLIESELLFDGSKIIIYYKLLTDKHKTNLRDLTRNLSLALKNKIELKQIYPRDEAKICGGLGPCGQSLCCSCWLTEYPHITVRMAKDQGLQISPSKTSGLCGRLLCCLKYEHEGKGDQP